VIRSGGQILVDQLERHGADLAFGVPGESYLPVLDALLDSRIEFVVCRHESAAANMAEAYGKLTGRPGVCLVTRGPGATHASVGVHTADHDSTPLILLIGQVPRNLRGRAAFQEIDYASFFGGIAKWAYEVDRPERLPEHVARAFELAQAGRPGPVVLALPEDVLSERCETEDAGPVPWARPEPGRGDLERLRELLAAAARPLAIVGEAGWSERAGRDLIVFAEESVMPVCASFRCQDYVDNHSPAYAGHLTLGLDPRLARRVEAADLILAVGGRLGEIPTQGYTLLEAPRPRQTLVHVHPDPLELGRVYEPDLPIVSGLSEFCAALRTVAPVGGADRRAWMEAARTDYADNLRPGSMPGDVDLGEVMELLRGRLPAGTIMTCGAGNFTVWFHRFYEFSEYRTQLAPRSGAMGYGFPAAVAAKLLHPDRTVVCFAGDGDFMMAAQELATAVKYELPIVVLVIDNGIYGTIRMHQERQFPGRVSGTDLVNPDFAALARAFGAYGARVERTEDFEEAFEGALASARPAVIDLVVDPEAISPRATITQLREGVT
jgi:acetolactate synthase-1/2/3 large subunit